MFVDLDPDVDLSSDETEVLTEAVILAARSDVDEVILIGHQGDESASFFRAITSVGERVNSAGKAFRVKGR